MKEPHTAQVEHYLRHTSGGEKLHRRVHHRAIRKNINDSGHLKVQTMPIVDRHHLSTGGVCDRGQVEDQICRSTACSVYHHSVLESVVRKDVRRSHTMLLKLDQRRRSSSCVVQPDVLPGRREGRVRDGQAQRLRDHL